MKIKGNRMKKLFVYLVSILAMLLALGAALLVRPDVPLTQLEPLYFTANSHYFDATIESLEGDELEIRVHYMDLNSSSSNTVVLLHGAFSSSHTFLPWADRLVEEGYRVVIMDQPNFGLSGGFSDDITSLRRTAAVLNDLTDHLMISSFHLAGNSLGGAVSWFFTSEYAEKVMTLTLIDAVYPSSSSDGRPDLSFLRNQPWLVSILSTFSPKYLLREILKTAYGDPSRLTDEVVTRYYDILRKSGTRRAILIAQQEVEPTPSYIERLQSITTPTYVLWGALDSWVPVELSEAFQTTMNLPNDHLFIYEGIGHVPMEEDPEGTIEDFLTILASVE